jgi:uncharacterized protein
MRLLKQLLAVAAVAFVGGQAVAAVQGNPWLTLVIGLLSAAAMVAVYRWVVRRTERRLPVELAGTRAAGAFGRGLLIGFTMFALVAFNIGYNGELRVHGLGSVPGAVSMLGFTAAAAISEELLFRGVLFRIIEERIGTWVALLLTGVVFGGMHLLNKDATLWGATAIAIEAGFMLAACYTATRTLWVPIGLHFGWNYALGGLSGLVVSGNGDTKGLLDVTISGPALYTGGDFGPEGGIATIGAGLLLTVIFMTMAYRRGNIISWGRRDASTSESSPGDAASAVQ